MQRKVPLAAFYDSLGKWLYYYAPETSQLFSRTFKQNSRTFQDSKKIQDFSRMWKPWNVLY